ncbi:MAG: glycosyltransferase [Treponema sp.]|nr:glycosyltransferase [Treponema sp.]
MGIGGGPLVSVLMPAYNHEKYVQDAIQSIIGQTYGNIELLVVNDGSSDATWQRITDMEAACRERFPRVVLWNQCNMGTCRTQNGLLDNARGDYVYLMASDDVALPHAIERELAFLEGNPEYALCVGDSAFIDGNGTECYWDRKCTAVYDKGKAEYLTWGDYLQRSRGFSFATDRFGSYGELRRINHIPNGYLVRKEAFRGFRYSGKAPLEDWSLMLHIAKYHRMKYLGEILFMYRWHGTNTVKDTTRIRFMENATRRHEEEVLGKTDLEKALPEVREYIERNSEEVPSARGLFPSAYRRLKLLGYSGIFSATQLPAVASIVPKRLMNRLLLKIFYLGDFRI